MQKKKEKTLGKKETEKEAKVGKESKKVKKEAKEAKEELKYCYKHPHPAVTTDCIIFCFDKKDLKVLLIQRGIEPFKDAWAFPGGFMRINESAEQCALRELKEETKLTPGHLEQFHTFTEVNRDPRERVITIAYFALVKKSDVEGGDDASDAKWFKVSEMPRLAFDHDYIFKMALTALKQKIHFEPIGFDLLEEEFSMPDLQRLYEAILDFKFDRRNFQKKILQLGILEESEKNEKREKATGRSKNKKWRFIPEKYEEMKTNKQFRLEF